MRDSSGEVAIKLGCVLIMYAGIFSFWGLVTFALLKYVGCVG